LLAQQVLPAVPVVQAVALVVVLLDFLQVLVLLRRVLQVV
jgi:hypothetical protein